MERIPALDGLRAVAILMVIGYHVDQDVLPAGYWGVIVFFVLSGYLITRLLCEEVNEDGGVDLASFYMKRGVRMIPALIVLCIALLAAGVAWSQVAPTLGFYANYGRIAGLDLGLLTHTWFLAVVAHFYLVWPLVIAAVPARHRVRAIGALAIVAIAWRLIAIGVASPGWVYNATDTNAAALLAGCYLGVARPSPWRFAGWSIPALLMLMFVPAFGEEGPAFHLGAFVALALGVLAVQYAVSRPAWLEIGPLVQLGNISYGLYLWHYVFLRMEIPIALAALLTILTTAASWYLVEKPMLGWWSRLEDRSRQRDLGRSTPHRADHGHPAMSTARTS